MRAKVALLLALLLATLPHLSASAEEAPPISHAPSAQFGGAGTSAPGAGLGASSAQFGGAGTPAPGLGFGAPSAQFGGASTPEEGAGLGAPQAQPTDSMEAAPKLEDLLDRAIRANPEIALARAEVQRAQAGLQETRLRVVRELTSKFHELQSLQEQLEQAQQIAQNQQQMHELGTVSIREAIAAREKPAQLRQQTQRLEAELNYLTGEGMEEPEAALRPVAPEQRGADETPSRGAEPGPAAAPRITTAQAAYRVEQRPPLPEKYETLLDAPLESFEIQEDDLKDLKAQLAAQLGVEVLYAPGPKIATNPPPVPALSLSNTTWRAVLHAVAHTNMEQRIALNHPVFLFRDEGVLVASRQQAQRMAGAAIRRRSRFWCPRMWMPHRSGWWWTAAAGSCCLNTTRFWRRAPRLKRRTWHMP